MPRTLKPLLLITDIGLIAYWLVVSLGLIPAAEMFDDYTESAVAAWNWSFLPLDLLASGTGLLAVALAGRDLAAWRPMALISLALTASAGLMAIAFWVIRCDLEAAWWVPNIYLLVYPVPLMAQLIGGSGKVSIDAA